MEHFLIYIIISSLVTLVSVVFAYKPEEEDLKLADLSKIDISAQNNPRIKTVLSVSPSSRILPILPFTLETKPKPNLPLLRVPQSYYKQYVIRVLQLDHRSLEQNLFIENYVFSAKSKDHDGYDYYLPMAFEKKDWGEASIAKLPKYLRDKAVLVKLEPNDVKCNCFSKF